MGVRSAVRCAAPATDTDADTILDSGANDYITKPFRMGVLLARLRAQLHQHAQSEDAIFGPYTFRPAAKMLLDQTGKKKIRLTEKEAAVPNHLSLIGRLPRIACHSGVT